MGTSRPTAITHAKFAPPFSHAHYPGGAMVARGGSSLAPYRHYARGVRTAITHGVLPTRNIRTATGRALPRPLPARCLPERIPVW